MRIRVLWRADQVLSAEEGKYSLLVVYMQDLSPHR